MSVRPAVPADAAALAALHGAAFPSGWSAADLAGLVGDPTVLAWVSEGQGFVLFRATPPEAEVLTVAVAPAQRRTGVARALIAAGLAQLAARGVTAVWLEVAVDNAAALGLYRSFAFQDAGRRRNYYARGTDAPVDALLLRRTLP